MMMSIFCPGVSWGRRRKALTSGASHRKAAVSRGISTDDLTASTASQESARCGCAVTKKNDQKEQPQSPGSDAFGGIYLGTENNNKPAADDSLRPGIDSIVYFDDSVTAQRISSANTTRSGTQYEPTPERADQPAERPLEQSSKLFIPNWIRNRRYLPTADDVDIDQIDEISLHSLSRTSLEATPERLRSLISDSSPIYQNLVDQELSDLYLQAQMNGLCYTSTPAKMCFVNVANPQVMTASSRTPPAVHQPRAGSLHHQGQQMHPRSISRDHEDSISLSSNDASRTLESPTTLTKLKSPKSRSPLRQLSSNTPPFQLVTSRAVKQRQESVASMNDPRNGKENHTARPQRSSVSAKKRAQRKPHGGTRKKSDLRKKALKRNISYKPIQEEDIDQIYMNTNSNQSVRLARNCAADDGASGSKVSNGPTSHSPKIGIKFLTDAFLKDFEELTLDNEILMPSCEIIDETNAFHPESQTDNSRRIDGGVIHKPQLVNTLVRQARVVPISPSPSSTSSSLSSGYEGDVSHPTAATVATSRTNQARPNTTKLGTCWSFVRPSPTTNIYMVNSKQYAIPVENQFRQTSAPEIRTIQNRLSHQPKRKIRNAPLRPREIDIIPEEVEPGNTEATSSPPFTPSISRRMVPSRTEPCAEGLILFDFAKRSDGDVSVKRGENVTVLNQQDRDWMYVKLDDGTEGFVPRSFVSISPLKGSQAINNPSTSHQNQAAASADDLEAHDSSDHDYQNLPAKQRKDAKSKAVEMTSPLPRRSSYKQAQLNNRRIEKKRRKGPSDRYLTLVETYVMIQDHVAKQIDELDLKAGDVVFVNSKQQRDNDIDWMWVLLPGSGRMGYIPAFAAQPVDFHSSYV